MRKRFRYRYETDNAVLIGNMEQIGEYVGKTRDQLKTERHLTGNPTKLNEYDILYDFVNYKTGDECIGIPHDAMKHFLSERDVKRLFANYREGCMFRNGIKIVAIRRRKLEVHDAERH